MINRSSGAGVECVGGGLMVMGSGGGGGGGGLGGTSATHQKQQHFPGFATTSPVGPPHSPESPPTQHMTPGWLRGDKQRGANE